MKIVKNRKTPAGDKHNVTVRLSEDTISKAGKIAVENDISRQKLLEAIIEQALSDKNFVLKL
jgi:predicted DNA binding CopG/RHH family protein